MPKKNPQQSPFPRLTAVQSAALIDKLFLAPAREKRAFFESPDFESLMTKFQRAAKRGTIDQEALKYRKRAGPFTADEFQKAFESVMECAPGEERHTRTEQGGFPLITKTYRGLDFIVLIGQGSTYMVRPAAPQPPSTPSDVKPKP